ncbi:unnamed protein product, partial [Effrenium voratum]
IQQFRYYLRQCAEDVKSQNCLVDSHGRGKVTDFGLAVVAEPEASIAVALSSEL